MSGSDQRGFILPLSVLLVIILMISGMSFLQHDFLERRMGINEVENHGAFYLALSGLERAREVFKFDLLPSAQPDWSPVLDETHPNHLPDFAEYPTDSTPNAQCPANLPLCLCPDPAGSGCVIPPFQTTLANGAIITADGDPVTDPDVPIAGIFPNPPADTVWYSVRAFDNEPDDPAPGLADGDGILTFRSLATVRGEDKLLEVTVVATSCMNLINCEGDPDDPCPEDVNGNPDIEPSPGREPASAPLLPFLDPPLSDVTNIYRDPATFPWITQSVFRTGDIKLTPTPDPTKPEEVLIQDNTYYYTDGEVTIQNTGTNTGVVVFSDLFDLAQDLVGVDVNTGVTLNDSIVIAREGVSMNGGVTLDAPLPYPAIISEGTVHGDANVEVFGTILTSGTIDLNPITVHGVLIGTDVEIQGGGQNGCQVAGGTCYTDDLNPAYYAFIPGVEYGDECLDTAQTSASWRELE